VCAAGQQRQRALGRVVCFGLAVGTAVDDDRRVDAEDPLAVHRPRLAQGVLDHHLARVAVLDLVDVRDDDLEVDPELGEDRPALR
jgi:hypothetical protein